MSTQTTPLARATNLTTTQPKITDSAPSTPRLTRRQRRETYILHNNIYTPYSSLPQKPTSTPVPRPLSALANRLANPSSTHTPSSTPSTALDTSLAHLALASAHLLRTGPPSSTANLRTKLWYFASGSWSQERWAAAVRAEGVLPNYLGVEVEEQRAGEAMRKALRALREGGKGEGEDGGGEWWRDARDLERVVGRFLDWGL